MGDKAYVETHWIRAELCPSPSGYSISLGGRGYTRLCVPKHLVRKAEYAWSKAAEVTRERLEEIRQVEYDIGFLEGFLNEDIWKSFEREVKSNLTRAQVALADLKHGMREV